MSAALAGKVEALAAAMRAWAGHSPWAALDFARRQPDPVRSIAMNAVLESLAHEPALAVPAARRLFAEEPARADEYGTILLGALVRAGHFDAALALVDAAPADSGAAWLQATLGALVRCEPAEAPAIAALLERQGIRGPIFATVIQNWAAAAPEPAVDFALTLPPGVGRDFAFNAALNQWLQADPAAVPGWISHLQDQREWDETLAALVASTDQVTRPTATALAWAESISDPTLRFGALARAVAEWAAVDRAAARNFATNAIGLSSAQRRQLLALAAASADGG